MKHDRPPTAASLLIRNARIVDGTAAPAFEGDVLIESGRIAAVSRGGRRLMQRARGYRRTIVAGETTILDDAATGARPGRLLRGAR